MRSSRHYYLEALIAKMSRDDARANREMGHVTSPKGPHAGKEVSTPGKTTAARAPSAR